MPPSLPLPLSAVAWETWTTDPSGIQPPAIQMWREVCGYPHTSRHISLEGGFDTESGVADDPPMVKDRGMLDLRPSCEHCDRDLPATSLNARICTFECTFCAECGDGVLGGVCPNCAGELVPRPTRPAAYGESATTERMHSPANLEAHVARRNDRPIDGDHAGVVLRRYADAWKAGDLDRLLACYADDFTLHYGGTSRFAGTHAGKDASIGVMADVSAVAPRTLESVDDVLVGRDGGALVVTETLVRDGESATIHRTLRYRVEDGLLRECWLLDEDQSLVDHYWR